LLIVQFERISSWELTGKHEYVLVLSGKEIKTARVVVADVDVLCIILLRVTVRAAYD